MLPISGVKVSGWGVEFGMDKRKAVTQSMVVSAKRAPCLRDSAGPEHRARFDGAVDAALASGQHTRLETVPFDDVGVVLNFSLDIVPAPAESRTAVVSVLETTAIQQVHAALLSANRDLEVRMRELTRDLDAAVQEALTLCSSEAERRDLMLRVAVADAGLALQRGKAVAEQFKDLDCCGCLLRRVSEPTAPVFGPPRSQPALKATRQQPDL